MVNVGDVTAGAVVKMVTLATAGTAEVKGALGIRSSETAVRTGNSRPVEAVTGAEAGPGMLSVVVV